MDLRQIENIIVIEQEQSISKAAEKLFLTQSALNQQLLRLEKELGVQLFERRKHRDNANILERNYQEQGKNISANISEMNPYTSVHKLIGQLMVEISE